MIKIIERASIVIAILWTVICVCVAVTYFRKFAYAMIPDRTRYNAGMRVI